jgi:hypothetical protein
VFPLSSFCSDARLEVLHDPPDNRNVRSPGDADPGTGSGPRDGSAVQIERDPVGADDERVAGAREVVIQFQIGSDHRAA